MTAQNLYYYMLDENGDYVLENGEKVLEYPATGHKDADKDGNCDTCTVDIVASCKCLCHSTNFLLKIIYKIINLIWKLLGISQICACGTVHY